ncbi:general transcriptional corepressor ssn6 [Drosophila novamexicana]|uniref:general transcriptional corepressor ssn6 n=1 Tax=Drosophila novamexicana TaxID=47314 RepID=UPI0011E5A8BB|nr:general transcriptional corepressor ssn6 [Drosophila novamexicana]
MTSPCGKCNTCPCSGQSNQAPRQQPVPQQQEQEIQQQQIQQPESSCQQPQQQQVERQLEKRSRVECHCVSSSKSSRRNTAPVQAPLADSYTCSRPRPQPQAALAPIEERCTCKAKAAPPQCECSPPVLPPPLTSQQRLAADRERAEAQQGTHAYITCGQPTPYRTQNQPQYSQYGNQQARAPCSHCRTQKKKKCSIQ